MKPKNYFFITCVIFGITFLVHVLRVFNSWNVEVEDFTAPMWFSWIALIVMGYLSFESFRHWRFS